MLIIEVTVFQSEVRFDLHECLEAGVASEAKECPAISLNICHRSIRSGPCLAVWLNITGWDEMRQTE